jgi:inositol-pentakisphosphate 2-kinase
MEPTPPTLPQNTDLTYLAEGAANIVFLLHLPPSPLSTPTDVDSYGPGTPPPTDLPIPTHPQVFSNKLLRLRKNIPSRVANASAVHFFQHTIAPLFAAENLISQDLIRLRPGMVEDWNGMLRQLEETKRRPEKRRGTYLTEEEEYGVLVTDMTAREGETLIQFKPKWLSQSPMAPKDARRCRTCALREMRNQERASMGKETEGDFCPFDLISDDSADVARAVDVIAHKHYQDMRDRIVKFVQDDELLGRLRKQQSVFAEQEGKLTTTMTLRDCTVFLKVPTGDREGKIEARLGDLDLKSEGKKAIWADLERRLVDGGWYGGRGGDGGGYLCRLGR